jgi:hypothetical protein
MVWAPEGAVCSIPEGSLYAMGDSRHKDIIDNYLRCFVLLSVSTRVDAGVSVAGDRQNPRPILRYLQIMVDFVNEDWTEADLDDEFPLGDGTAETETLVTCPHCGEMNEIALDPGSGSDQEYIEDCHVCCRPILMYVKYARDGSAVVEVYASDA